MIINFENYYIRNGGITAPHGFRASGIHCGIRKNKQKKDLALVFSTQECDTACVYTQNLVKGAPIIVTQRNVADFKSRAIIVNSGIANTCNADGEQKATKMCEMLAKEMRIKPTDVVVASTGVIGQPLDLVPIKNGLKQLVSELSADGNNDAAQAIMTTDLVDKQIAVSFVLDGKDCTIGAMAKGSGMINPNMATMLCFVTTDVNIDPEILQKALKYCVDDTLNMVSVDGDTSTNDMTTIMANGLANNKRIDEQNEDFDIFVNALYVVLMNLSRMIAADGEGATKLLECLIEGAKTQNDARKVAKAVISSSLVKAAMFGKDANWGRILCAIGYANADVEINEVDISLASENGVVKVCENGMGLNFDEEKALEVLKADEIKVCVDLGSGEQKAVAWGCDLTYDYVKINGDYRT